MNDIIRICAALLLCLFSAQSLSAAEPAGKVLSAKTAVTSSGSEGKRTLRANDPVFHLDRLSTNATGTGEFMFKDGTKLALGPSASLVVDRFVQKNRSTFQQFGVAATKGTFRWISGSSPSLAYRIRTPTGTMGIRGTALDVTTRNGVTHVVLLNGSAQFCAGPTCRVLNRSGDYISINGRSISPKKKVQTAFKSKKEAARIFPFLANPRLLSARFRVAGSNLLSGLAFGEEGNSRGGVNRAVTGGGFDRAPDNAGPDDGGGDDGGGDNGGDNGGGGNGGGDRGRGGCRGECGKGNYD